MEYRNLNDFLNKHRTKEKVGITHTKIGNGKDILPGKFIIPENDYDLFLKLYNKHVFIDKKDEYLTEVQSKDGNGPILIDLDFRYEKSIKKRQHTKEHIEDFVMLCLEKMNELLDIPEDNRIRVFILEKDNVNLCDDKFTKDGIHIVINVKMNHILQCILREEVLKNIDDVFADIKFENSYEEIFDDGISKGHTNWQMFGSKKPNHEPYKLKRIIDCIIDLNDNDISIDDIDIKKMNNISLLRQISAKNKDCIYFPTNEETMIRINNYSKKKTNLKLKKKKKLKLTNTGFNFDMSEIKNKDILNGIIEEIMNEVSNTEKYYIKETHMYTMALSKEYYGPGSYNKWIRVGWALANTSEYLFPTWLLFSSQDECRMTLRGINNTFDWNYVPDLYEMWCGFDKDNNNGLTHRSIMYWCKESNNEEYKNINEQTVDYFIEKSIQSPTEWDIAYVLYQLYKDQYRCASLKNKLWYQYKNNRWHFCDSGTTLRFNISKRLSKLYSEKSDQYMNLVIQYGSDNPEMQEKYQKLCTKFSEVSSNLKRTNFKKNIMIEAAEIFYQADPNFYQKLDTNKDLLCFNNGILDFAERCFRPGKPEDYVSLCTNIDHIDIDYNNEEHIKIMDEINDFMYKLFPIEELRRYMWEHLASSLIGYNKNQTFNIYNGSGSNGKSKLVELMTKVLGDYKGTVPITLVTSKRNGIGSLSPEIAALKGVRYAPMNEPTKGDKLNDGVMKELTGEDPIQGRGLFKDPVEFVPQFTLAVCTNNLFDIKSNEDGTWRRIRLCEFMSKFVDEPYHDKRFPKESYPYQFKLDRNLDKKFEKWHRIFMSMLIEILFKTNGVVKDCDLVLSASNEYRKGQDYLLEFKCDKIQKASEPNKKIKRTEVYAEFKLWYQQTYGKNVPKGKELYDYLDIHLGKYKNGWKGYEIKYDDVDDEEENI